MKSRLIFKTVISSISNPISCTVVSSAKSHHPQFPLCRRWSRLGNGHANRESEAFLSLCNPFQGLCLLLEEWLLLGLQCLLIFIKSLVNDLSLAHTDQLLQWCLSCDPPVVPVMEVHEGGVTIQRRVILRKLCSYIMEDKQGHIMDIKIRCKLGFYDR